MRTIKLTDKELDLLLSWVSVYEEEEESHPKDSIIMANITKKLQEELK